MTLLRHTNLQMTSRYSHAMPENLRTAVESLTKGPLASAPKIAIAQAKLSLTVGLQPRSSRSVPLAPEARQLATGTHGYDGLREATEADRRKVIYEACKLLKIMAEGTGLEPA